MTCKPGGDRYRCPDKWALFQQIKDLLPRGRAWQTHDDVCKNDVDGLTTQEQYWFVFAEQLEYWMQSACALTEEFFCHSVEQTEAEWQEEFGIPDQCSPWINVCDKMTWEGEGRCDYFAEIAFELGWKITCSYCRLTSSSAGCAIAGCAVAGSGGLPDDISCCGTVTSAAGNARSGMTQAGYVPLPPERTDACFQASAGCAQAGSAKAGCSSSLKDPCTKAVIFVRVLTQESPAYDDRASAVAGCATAGCASLCQPDVNEIECLLAQYTPAHLQIVYEVV